jgi:hypothetical protein
LPILTAIGWIVAAPAQALEQAYSFVSFDGGTSTFGTIVLDSTSSSGGVQSDIVAAYCENPYTGGVYNLFAGGGGVYTFVPPMTWYASQITEMTVLFEGNVGGSSAFDMTAEAGPGSSGIQVCQEAGLPGQSDTSGDAGTWEAAGGNTGIYDLASAGPSNVPDGGATALLFGVALSGLALLKRKVMA